MKQLLPKVYKKFLNVLPRGMAHKLLYRRMMHKKLDLKNPKGFNEKLHYLMVNKYGKREGLLADKARVKAVVEKMRIKDLNVPKTLKIYHSANDIDLDELPDKFVLKCNHGSGDIFICRDKKNFDIKKAKRVLSKTLKQDFSKVMLEYHYSYIKPVIIAEELLDDGSGKGMVDYKFYCFNGQPKYLYVSEGLDNHETAIIDFFDMDFNPAEFGRSDYHRFKVKPSVPKDLERMKEIAHELSKNDDFVRIDLYDINGKIYFGEFTFSPCAGFMPFDPPEWDEKLGEMLNLRKTKSHNEK